MIYQDPLNDGRDKGWSDIYIHFSHHHQHFIRHFERKSGWSLETYFHVLHNRPYYLTFQIQVYSTIYHGHPGYGRKSGWYGTYIRLYHHYQLFLPYCKREIIWYLNTYIHAYHNQLLYTPSIIHHHDFYIYLRHHHHNWSHPSLFNDPFTLHYENKLAKSKIYHGHLVYGRNSF